MPGEKEMIEHAKGPWRAVENPNNPGHWIVIASTHQTVVYQVAGGKDHAKANARLIAAAPDLLIALKEAEEFVDRHSESWYISGQELLTKIRTAIAATRTS